MFHTCKTPRTIHEYSSLRASVMVANSAKTTSLTVKRIQAPPAAQPRAPCSKLCLRQSSHNTVQYQYCSLSRTPRSSSS
ncbi:hypothetical protein RRG08_022080 [Elysia crispata]|uniref:Uncharacterized protein n=1 Tax=Elysia crispata TaxID=231223 RepID=A0AAE0Y1J6_9GAST|nr:hypothetical protein RRG08_022080 [Elysia crispata]